MSRGTQGNIFNVQVAKNSRTKMFDNLARYAWNEHGIIMLHQQDGRIPGELRDILIERWNKKYGRRV